MSTPAAAPARPAARTQPAGAAAHVERLLVRRTPRTTGRHRLVRRSIYVVPTRAGLLFAVVMAAMLFAAINYVLSLGYLLTFLLLSVALVSMLHTYRNLAGLALVPGRAEPVFAGDLADFTATVENPARGARYALQFELPGLVQPIVHDVAGRAETRVSLGVPTTVRGRLALPRVRIATTWPLGLWRAWAYWRPAGELIVYAQPETPPVPLPEGSGHRHAPHATAPGDDEPAGIRAWRDGDPLRRVAWKAMARSPSDQPLTMTFDGPRGGDLRLAWTELPATLDREQRIARLTRWVLDAEAAGLSYALQIPGRTVEAGSGAAHRLACLEALALHEAPSGAGEPVQHAAGTGAHRR